MKAGFWILIAFIVGLRVGWGEAHQSVATECERLGGFYAGQKTFKCIEVKNVE